jgi:hypothetical protein
MSQSVSIGAFLSLLLLATSPARAAADPLEERIGAAASVALFDRDLHAALATADPVAMAMLVSYPLRVNFPDGSALQLANPAAIVARFAEVFPPQLRAAVALQEGPEWMGGRGFMYAHGLLWGDQIRPSIESERDADGRERAADYRLTTVNVPEEKAAPKTPGRKIEFTCGAKLQRLIVDSDSAGKLRLRAWERPRSLSEKPDLEIAGGEWDVQGTSSCASASWTFRTPATAILLRQRSCQEGPDDALGILEVTRDGATGEWWCF